jgi:hypothetical protein
VRGRTKAAALNPQSQNETQQKDDAELTSDCTFNEATHTYKINGRSVPSVTQVLGDLLPCYRAGEWYKARGRAVHAAAELERQGWTRAAADGLAKDGLRLWPTWNLPERKAGQ